MRQRRMTIGHLARDAGTKVETVRYYERIGLLRSPERTTGNYRTYGITDLERLRFIRRARSLGFSLPQVRGLLKLASQSSRSCKGVDQIARGHLRDVRDKIADLLELRRELNNLVVQCKNQTVAECRVINALGSSSLSKARNALRPLNSSERVSRSNIS
jgi:DNA-binding transcriptional MerR regulator